MKPDNFAAIYRKLYDAMERERLAAPERLYFFLSAAAAEASTIASNASEFDGIRVEITREFSARLDRAKAHYFSH